LSDPAEARARARALVAEMEAGIERSGAWDVVLELDLDALLEFLEEWILEQHRIAPLEREHLAMVVALAGYWRRARDDDLAD
jgi:hypothetical protein